MRTKQTSGCDLERQLPCLFLPVQAVKAEQARIAPGHVPLAPQPEHWEPQLNPAAVVEYVTLRGSFDPCGVAQNILQGNDHALSQVLDWTTGKLAVLSLVSFPLVDRTPSSWHDVHHVRVVFRAGAPPPPVDERALQMLQQQGALRPNVAAALRATNGDFDAALLYLQECLEMQISAADRLSSTPDRWVCIPRFSFFC